MHRVLFFVFLVNCSFFVFFFIVFLQNWLTDRTNSRNINPLFTIFVTDIFLMFILSVVYPMFSRVGLGTFFRKGIWNVLILCILKNVFILPPNINDSLDRHQPHSLSIRILWILFYCLFVTSIFEEANAINFR